MRITIFWCLIAVCHTSLANDLEIGISSGLGYIPKSSDELGRGGYGYLGIYIGTDKRKLDAGIMTDSDECNEKHHRIAYSQYFSLDSKPLLWGVELIDLSREDSAKCRFGGSEISVPLPFVGYRKYINKENVKISADLLIHINRIGASLNIGF